MNEEHYHHSPHAQHLVRSSRQTPTQQFDWPELLSQQRRLLEDEHPQLRSVPNVVPYNQSPSPDHSQHHRHVVHHESLTQHSSPLASSSKFRRQHHGAPVENVFSAQEQEPLAPISQDGIYETEESFLPPIHQDSILAKKQLQKAQSSSNNRSVHYSPELVREELHEDVRHVPQQFSRKVLGGNNSGVGKGRNPHHLPPLSSAKSGGGSGKYSSLYNQPDVEELMRNVREGRVGQSASVDAKHQSEAMSRLSIPKAKGGAKNQLASEAVKRRRKIQEAQESIARVEAERSSSARKVEPTSYATRFGGGSGSQRGAAFDGKKGNGMTGPATLPEDKIDITKQVYKKRQEHYERRLQNILAEMTEQREIVDRIVNPTANAGFEERMEEYKRREKENRKKRTAALKARAEKTEQVRLQREAERKRMEDEERAARRDRNKVWAKWQPTRHEVKKSNQIAHDIVYNHSVQVLHQFAQAAVSKVIAASRAHRMRLLHSTSETNEPVFVPQAPSTPQSSHSPKKRAASPHDPATPPSQIRHLHVQPSATSTTKQSPAPKVLSLGSLLNENDTLPAPTAHNRLSSRGGGNVQHLLAGSNSFMLGASGSLPPPSPMNSTQPMNGTQQSSNTATVTATASTTAMGSARHTSVESSGEYVGGDLAHDYSDPASPNHRQAQHLVRDAVSQAVVSQMVASAVELALFTLHEDAHGGVAPSSSVSGSTVTTSRDVEAPKQDSTTTQLQQHHKQRRASFSSQTFIVGSDGVARSVDKHQRTRRDSTGLLVPVFADDSDDAPVTTNAGDTNNSTAHTRLNDNKSSPSPPPPHPESPLSPTALRNRGGGTTSVQTYDSDALEDLDDGDDDRHGAAGRVSRTRSGISVGGASTTYTHDDTDGDLTEHEVDDDDEVENEEVVNRF